MLRGSIRLISSGLLDVLSFEYHERVEWETVQLADVVDMLDKHGFTCFLDSKLHLFVLTGCWIPTYEFHKWSNVFCAARSRPILVNALYSGSNMPHVRLSVPT